MAGGKNAKCKKIRFRVRAEGKKRAAWSEEGPALFLPNKQRRGGRVRRKLQQEKNVKGKNKRHCSLGRSGWVTNGGTTGGGGGVGSGKRGERGRDPNDAGEWATVRNRAFETVCKTREHQKKREKKTI